MNLAEKEFVNFNYLLISPNNGPFQDNITITVDLNGNSEEENKVRLVGHFMRFLNSIGFDTEDLPDVMNSILEAEEEYDKEQEELSSYKKEDTVDLNPKVFDNLSSFNSEILESENFRKYLYRIFQEDNER